LGEPLASCVVDPDVEKYWQIDPSVIVNVAVDKIAGGVSEQVRAEYLKSYTGDRFVESMRYVRRYRRELPELRDLLPMITTPVTLINGRNDPDVPFSNAEFLHARLPNGRLVAVDTGHFIWEEAPDLYAGAIIESLVTK
jgi:pimeloyl-ACP methyl ester carboxylesterase